MSEPTKDGQHPAESIRDIILDEFQKGNIVVATPEGLRKTSMKEFIKQPVEGMLYDLNRDEATILTLIKENNKWINDFAVCKVIQELKSLTFKERPKEFIICAANHYNDGVVRNHGPKNIERGFVTSGRRHHDCIQTFADIVGFPYNEVGKTIMQTEIQGFLTNTNRFVDRKEAYKIAFEADQIYGPNKGQSENSIGLTSEDLY